VEAELARELPGLRIRAAPAEVPDPRTPPGVEHRLALMADRLRGARAVALGQESVPAAYRRLFRAIGLDPDVDRTPIEAEVLERLRFGGLPSRGRLADALRLGILETGVALLALDEALLAGPVGLRRARAGEPLEPGAAAPPAGTLVLADARRPLGILFGALAPGVAARGGAGRVRIVAVQAPGVPELVVREAVWTCLDVLEA
jgi:DNA/RNA-binding domain of Phe-tRNA-synthetase-like protein